MTMLPDAPDIEDALEWFTRLTKRSVSAHELLTFQVWRRDPSNAAAYAKIERSQINAARLSTDPPIEPSSEIALDTPRPTVTWQAIPKPRTAFGMAGVAIAIGAGSLLLQGKPERYGSMPTSGASSAGSTARFSSARDWSRSASSNSLTPGHKVRLGDLSD